MMSSRGMGAISPSKMPKGKKTQRRDSTDFTQFAKGGWIQKAREAMGKPGALHAQMGVPQGQKIPAKALSKAAKAGGTLGKRARLAETFKSFKK